VQVRKIKNKSYLSHRHCFPSPQDLKELLFFSEQKVQNCLQSFQEFEEKLKLFEERKLSMSKAAKRGATRVSMERIDAENPLAHSGKDSSNPTTVAPVVVVPSSLEEDQKNNKKKIPSSSSLVSAASSSSLLLFSDDYSVNTATEEETAALSKKKILGTLLQTEDTVVYYR
jgi:hypothetical protein